MLQTLSHSNGDLDDVTIEDSHDDSCVKPERTSDTEPRRSVIRLSTIEEIISEALQFQPGDTELLRATPLESVLHQGANVLANNSGNASTYSLSHPVNGIDYFLSHNWSVGRLIKFLTLVLHFNARISFVAGITTSFLCLCLTANELLPMRKSSSTFTDVPIGIFGHLLATPVALTVMIARYEILRFAGRGPLCFLDKTCIHQTRQTLKQRGISKLGAFLASSKRILVLYSDVYLRKLWTIYEVACFSVVRSIRDIELVHTSVVLRLFQVWIALYFATCLWYVHHLLPLSIVVQYSLMWFTLCFLFTVFSRRLGRELSSTWTLVKEFDVKKALCFDEDDRPIVEMNIAAFMITNGFSEGGEKDKALQAFNQMVSKFVIRIMQISLGDSAIPFLHTVMLMLLIDFTMCMDIAAGLIVAYGISDTRTWGYLLATFAADFSICPLCGEFASFLMSRAQHLTGWREWLWIVFGAFATLILGTVVDGVNMILLELARESAIFMCCFLASNCILIGSAVAWELRRRKRKSDLCCSLDNWTPSSRKTGMYYRKHADGTESSNFDAIRRLRMEQLHDEQSQRNPSLRLSVVEEASLCEERSIESFGTHIGSEGVHEGETSNDQAFASIGSAGSRQLSERSLHAVSSSFPRVSNASQIRSERSGQLPIIPLREDSHGSQVLTERPGPLSERLSWQEVSSSKAKLSVGSLILTERSGQLPERPLQEMSDGSRILTERSEPLPENSSWEEVISSTPRLLLEL